MVKIKIDIEANKKKVIELLLSTKREGMEDLIEYLESSDFFIAPASTKWHGAYKGGLVHHSLCVYEVFGKLIEINDLKVSEDTKIIASILHDVNKIFQYLKEGSSYKWNPENPEGHSTLSLKRINKFIKLTEIEKELIQYHMSMYGTNEFAETNGWGKGEYSLKELSTKYNENKLAKLFYFADDISTQFYEDKKQKV